MHPGFRLCPSKAPEAMRETMRRLGVYYAEVQPDSSAVVFRKSGFPRNFGYVYRLAEP